MALTRKCMIDFRSRRLLGVVARCVRDSDGNVLRDRKGRKRIKYYLRRDVWGTIQTRFGFDYPQEPGANGNHQRLFLNEFVEKKIERERLERELAFDSKLFNPSVTIKLLGILMPGYLIQVLAPLLIEG
jgi:hypothetical protein